jgi:hypothetical protein
MAQQLPDQPDQQPHIDHDQHRLADEQQHAGDGKDV